MQAARRVYPTATDRVCACVCVCVCLLSREVLEMVLVLL